MKWVNIVVSTFDEFWLDVGDGYVKNNKWSSMKYKNPNKIGEIK
jgi:hypothetical protein